MTESNQKLLPLQKPRYSSVNLAIEREVKRHIFRLQTESPTQDPDLAKLTIKGIHQGPELPPIQMLSPNSLRPLQAKKFIKNLMKRDAGIEIFNDYIGPITPHEFETEHVTKRNASVSLHSAKNKTDKKRKILFMPYKENSPGRKNSPNSRKGMILNTSVEEENEETNRQHLVGNFNLFDKTSHRGEQNSKSSARGMSLERKKSEKQQVKSPEKEVKTAAGFQSLYHRINEEKKNREMQQSRRQEKDSHSNNNDPTLQSLKTKLKQYQTENVITGESQASLRANPVDLEGGVPSKVELAVRKQYKNVSNSAKFLLAPVMKPMAKPNIRRTPISIKKKMMKKVPAEIHVTEIYRAQKEEMNQTLRLQRSDTLGSDYRKNSKNASVQDRVGELVNWTSRKVLDKRRPWRKLVVDPVTTLYDGTASILSTTNPFAKSMYKDDSKKSVSKVMSPSQAKFRDTFSKNMLGSQTDNPTEKYITQDMLLDETSENESDQVFTRIITTQDHNREWYRGEGRYTRRKSKESITEYEESGVLPKSILEKKLKNESGKNDGLGGWYPDDYEYEALGS